MALSPQVTNLVIILGMMQVSKRVPMEDPNMLNIIRAGYVLSNVFILCIYAYVHFIINKKKDLTTLKYIDAPPMATPEQSKLITTTIHAYDIAQMKSLYKAQLMGVGMMAVMHLYFKYTNPLLIQSIIPLKSALESPVVTIHLFGKPATGDLKRPFKQSGGLLNNLKGGPQQAQDKKAIESAEMAGKGGAKEE